MSKTPAQRKDERARRIIIIQAAALAVVLHLLLGFGFFYKSPPAQIPQGKPLFNYMVALDSSQEDVIQLKNWLKYQDPTLFIRPSREYGFSSTPHRSRFDRKPEDGKTATSPDGISLPSKKAINLKAPPVSVMPLAGYVPTPPRPGRMASSSPVPPKKYPALLDAKHKIILSPEIKGLKLTGITNPTELTIIAAGNKMYPRVVLKKSCGRTDLDVLAANLVMKACITGKIDASKEQDLSMLWMGGVK